MAHERIQRLRPIGIAVAFVALGCRPQPPPRAATPPTPLAAAQRQPRTTAGSAAPRHPEPAPTQVDPDLADSVERAKREYLRGGRNRLLAARQVLEEVLARAPEYADALLILAQVQLELGDEAASLSTAQRCVSIAPEIADCWLTLGVLHTERKDYESAIAAYAHYLALAPDGRYAKDVAKQLDRLQRLEGGKLL